MLESPDVLDGAVRNNAAWVASVHAAHGHAVELGPDLWLTHGEPLRFYPNAVTLTPDGASAQTERLRDLVAAGLPAGWSIKDSYASLDLAPLGFEQLFEAQWIGRLPVGTAIPDEGVRWIKVRSAATLASWERAWVGQEGSSKLAARSFLPALLADPDIAFLGAYATRMPDAGPVAGLIVNRSGEGASPVAGVSNLFLPEASAEPLRATALAAAEAAFPRLPLVGYERGADLKAMCAQGFAALGSLRVWAYAA
jgi:hypothetical protein